ncbi:Sugar phosphate permease [Marinobacter daqiaonensis]|uniref:Sugar phosphate permease n=1 Tax=Marinobacter daqiaonensis TaxID=650891 RepID=A0A1I6IDA5_9GAMM|nr:MCT family MFS transporter [Marinobacter daqiaonensis]SFR64757.1 Sugar phosphate permease [Marinobacter daqiaonensis]
MTSHNSSTGATRAEDQKRPGRLFYGWYVVAAAFAVTFVGFGAAYSFSAFVDALQQEFSASRGEVSLVFSIAGFLYFGLGVITGPLADRFGSRPMAIIGMVLVATGLVLAGFAQSLTQVYLAYGLGVGLGVGFSYVPSVGTVQRWFARRRGFASGLAVSGIGFGTLFMPLLAALLIGTLGWRNAYISLGILSAALGISMALLIVNDPRSRGLGPDGGPPLPPASAGGAEGAGLKQAVRSRPFLTLYCAGLIASFGLFVPFVHLVPFATDHGMSPGEGAFLLGMVGVGSTVGRFLLGNVADLIGRRTALILAFAGMSTTLVIWALSTSLIPLAIFGLTFGTFYGGFVALMPALVMDYFGGRNVSGIIGVLYTSVALGTLVGPTAAGYAYDLTQDYTLAILGSIAVNLVAALAVATLPRPDPGNP